jgi:hypothetical protein
LDGFIPLLAHIAPKLAKDLTFTNREHSLKYKSNALSANSFYFSASSFCGKAPFASIKEASA